MSPGSAPGGASLPASSKSTPVLERADSLLASTQPAAPPPTMITSKLVVIFLRRKVIALRVEKLLHQPPRQHSGNPAAIVAGRECRFHRHDLIAHQRVQPLEYAFVELVAAECLGTGKTHRPRVGAREGNAQVGELVAVAPQRHSHARN